MCIAHVLQASSVLQSGAEKGGTTYGDHCVSLSKWMGPSRDQRGSERVRIDCVLHTCFIMVGVSVQKYSCIWTCVERFPDSYP